MAYYAVYKDKIKNNIEKLKSAFADGIGKDKIFWQPFLSIF